MTATVADAPRFPAVTRLWRDSRTRPHPAVLVLAVVISAWVVTFAVLVVRRHDAFWDLDFDMGIHDQSIWLLSQGRGFITVRGLHVFGHHLTLDYFLFVPFYWLGAGPNFLNIVQVLVLALAAVPIYLLARERKLDPWTAAVLGAVFLLHPSLQFFAWELFHPETIAITPLLCAYLCSVRRSWGWFTFWAVLTVSCKEDLALPILVLGLLIALRGDRKVGLITSALSAAWFGLVTMVVIPTINGGHHLAEEFLRGVGGSPGGIVETLFTDPGAITSRLFSNETGTYAWKLILPFAFVPLLAPLVLLMALPQFLISAFADVPWMRAFTFHYAAIPLVALGIAMVEGAAWISARARPAVRRAVPLVLLATSVFGSVAWGLSPIGQEYRQGWWPPVTDPRLDAKAGAVAMVPDDVPVSATYGLVPQLTHRPKIYSFPNPWQNRNWGVEGSATDDPADVEWLVLDRQVLSPDDFRLLASILDDFRIVFDEDDLLVARRRAGP